MGHILCVVECFILQEGTNLGIKRDYTLRELILFNIFKVSSMDMVRQMSLRYDANTEEAPKVVASLPKISNEVCKIVTKMK